jgi:integrase
MSPLTDYQYRRFVARFNEYQAGHPSPLLVEQLREWLATLPVSAQAHARAALKRALGRLVEWDDVGVARYRRNRATLQASILSTREQDTLLASLQTSRERAAAHCLFTLRRVEVARMAWSDIDWAERVAYIPRGKQDKPRWTLLSAGAVEALAMLYAEEARPTSGPVFRSLRGGHLRPNSLGTWFDGLVRRAGLKRPGRNCHALRRTMATSYLRANPGDLDGLREVMGHESIATTVLYNYPQPADLAPRLARALSHCR